MRSGNARRTRRSTTKAAATRTGAKAEEKIENGEREGGKILQPLFVVCAGVTFDVTVVFSFGDNLCLGNSVIVTR